MRYLLGEVKKNQREIVNKIYTELIAGLEQMCESGQFDYYCIYSNEYSLLDSELNLVNKALDAEDLFLVMDDLLWHQLKDLQGHIVIKHSELEPDSKSYTVSVWYSGKKVDLKIIK